MISWTTTISVVLICLGCLTHGITVNNSDSRHIESTTATSYRVSVPKIKTPPQRVPAHLQGIRAGGLVYDDADDVIHVIEPPKHFQQLKRLINQKGEAAVWQQRGMVSISAPKAAKHGPAKQEAMKVKESKVESPLKLRSAAKPALGAASADADLLTQETKLEPDVRQVQQLSFPAHLPLEILASVRKTERILQQQRPALPRARQRIKTKKTHTVIMAKHFQREQFQRGNEFRQGGKRTHSQLREKRTKRDVSGLGEVIQAMAHNESNEEVLAHKLQKKLETMKYDVKSGNKLLSHINALLSNATYYLNSAEVYGEASRAKKEALKPDKRHRGASKNDINNAEFDKLSKREAAVKDQTSSTTTRRSILEPTSPATLANEPAPTSDSNTTSKSVISLKKHFGERINEKINSTLLTHEIYNKVQKREGPRRKRRKSRTLYFPSLVAEKDAINLLQNISATLLYDDVMTNIRNMWHDKNLQNPPETPSFVTPGDANEFDDKSVQQHINELDKLNATISSNSRSFTDFTLNSNEFINGTSLGETPAADWFIVNDEGKIFEANLEHLQPPKARIFHRFPDIPGAEGYIRNRTLLAQNVNTHEIL